MKPLRLIQYTVVIVGAIAIVIDLLTRYASAGVPAPAVIGAAAPTVQATIYSADWCGHCRPYLAAVRREMPPDGWKLADAGAKDAATAHLVIDKNSKANTENFEFLPTTLIRRDGKEVDRIVGRVTPTELANRINTVRKG